MASNRLIWKIEPAVMNYPWGSRDSVERLLNRSNASGEPVAELWFGAHPRGPSVVSGSKATLADLLYADPKGLLGDKTAQQFSGRFPFLFKVLSAKKGLSIQAHPSKTQAERGFSRENSEGIPIDAPHRNYRDDNHKPECIVALEDFWALSGFRHPEHIAGHFRGCSQSPLGLRLETALEATGAHDEQRLREFYSILMSAPVESQLELLSYVLDYQKTVPNRDDAKGPWYWLGELNRQFPDDPGALAPLYLNVIRLRRGEGLFMNAGLLHAYLRGTGLEIMANSDNVLRGGCTSKHVDPPELVKVLNFVCDEPHLVQADEAGWYPSPVPEFQLARIEQDGELPRSVRHDFGLALRPAVVLVESGVLEIRAGTETLVLQKGESAFLAAGQHEVESMTPEGDAAFALASVNRL